MTTPAPPYRQLPNRRLTALCRWLVRRWDNAAARHAAKEADRG